MSYFGSNSSSNTYKSFLNEYYLILNHQKLIDLVPHLSFTLQLNIILRLRLIKLRYLFLNCHISRRWSQNVIFVSIYAFCKYKPHRKPWNLGCPWNSLTPLIVYCHHKIRRKYIMSSKDRAAIICNSFFFLPPLLISFKSYIILVTYTLCW